MVRRLADAHEHLDGTLDAHLLDGNLRDLARINRRLGGVAITRRALRAFADSGRPGLPLTMLDVGTGAADIPAALLAAADPDSLAVTAVDARPQIVDWARTTWGSRPDLSFAVADGTRLPWPDRHFDVAHVSLVLHHLEPAAATALLAELRRVARVGVIVNDLDRGRLPWLGAWLLIHATTRNKYTRHDGPMSVRRAYRPVEVGAFATPHGLREVARHWAPFRHRYAIAYRVPELDP